jgi:hypothetical protein
VSHEDEVSVSYLIPDEVIQASSLPTQGVFNHFPFQIFDDALFYDLESEKIVEPLDVPDPSCYNEIKDVIENIDEFIHVGGCKRARFCMM